MHYLYKGKSYNKDDLILNRNNLLISTYFKSVIMKLIYKLTDSVM